MADIELLIKISEEMYKTACNYPEMVLAGYPQCIKNGTPLPKGHGRLKDIDKIISDGRSKGFCDWYDEMKYADTIIEADMESEESDAGSN